MKHIYLTDSIIHYPKTNCIYHLKAGPFETIITFAGILAFECCYFDVSTGLYFLKNGIQGTIIFDDICLLSNESLPWGVKNTPKLPLFLYQHSEGKFAILKSFHLDFDDYFSHEFSFQYFMTQFDIDNEKIKSECQKQAGALNVVVGNYPIIAVKSKPDISFLSDLYQKFIKYNTDDKLNNQYRHSEDLCFARAHFISELLNLYGIRSIKLFKMWNSEDWKHFQKELRWKFHCAVMVVDKENNQWIWDPWVGFNHRLLTLKEWLFRKDEPMPIKLLIANSLVTNPFSEGNAAYGSRFSQHTPEMIRAFQAVTSDAVPNPPILSLPRIRSTFRFFPKKEITYTKDCTLNENREDETIQDVMQQSPAR